MEYHNLKIDIGDNIAIVTINRPQALNALNKDTISELDQFFTKDGPAIEGLKGIIITGAGEKAFIAGADIKEFQGLNAAQGSMLAEKGQRVFAKIETYHVPVIAAVNGFALGGGCELAMACHLRIVSENAKFGQPEVNLGLIPGYGGTQRLPLLVGKGRALDLLMTARMIDAQTALQWGLANEVVSLGDLIERCKAIIKAIGEKAPQAITKVIACVNAHYEKGHAGYIDEVQEFGNCMETEDVIEGVNAFLEKRKADFKGK